MIGICTMNEHPNGRDVLGKEWGRAVSTPSPGSPFSLCLHLFTYPEALMNFEVLNLESKSSITKWLPYPVPSAHPQIAIAIKASGGAFQNFLMSIAINASAHLPACLCKDSIFYDSYVVHWINKVDWTPIDTAKYCSFYTFYIGTLLFSNKMWYSVAKKKKKKKPHTETKSCVFVPR